MPALGTVTGSGATGSLAMPTMAEAFAFRPDPTNPGQFISGYTLQDRFGIVPILTDTRGQITATVTVGDGRGQSASASLTLNAASVNGGTSNVPQSASASTSTAATPAPAPGRSQRSPRARPRRSTIRPAAPRRWCVDRFGSYTLAEGGHTMTITAGYLARRGRRRQRRQRHRAAAVQGLPPEPSPTRRRTCSRRGSPTGHATMFTRGINGEVSNLYSAACIGCHTVG